MAAGKRGYELSDREEQILKLVIQGKLNKEIGTLLGISQSTVEKHLTKIYAKLRVRNRIEATLHYRSENSRKP